MKLRGPISALFPPRCAICRKILSGTGYVCTQCWEKLPRIPQPRCRICSLPLASEFSMPECADCRAGVPYEKCFVPFLYSDGIRGAILNMKFRRRPSMFRYFAREIAAEIGDFRPDFITFVPQSRKAWRERGYNQTELIARELGKLLKVPVKSTLIRAETGENQVGLSYSARIKNAPKLYSPKDLQLSGTCLIVDDVITTGATMKACCRLLLKMGCSHVFAAAVAKTERGRKN